MITDQLLQDMDNGLHERISCNDCRFVYQLLSEYNFIITFIFKQYPTDDDISIIKGICMNYLDKFVPYRDNAPAWLATIEVGSQTDGHLAFGGTIIDTLAGGSNAFPGAVSCSD